MEAIYLDNAATSFPKPAGVSDRMKYYLDCVGANVNRSVYTAAQEAGLVTLTLRQRLAQLFDFPEPPTHVILTSGATAGLNMIISGLLRPGDHCIVSSMEHNAVMRPLLRLPGVAVSRVPCDAEGFADLDALPGLFRENTRLVIMAHGSNVCGAVQDATAIGRICTEKGVPFALDAAQTAGHLPVDFQAFGLSAMAVPGHKGLLGPGGVGALLLRDDFAKKLTPLIAGGTGSASDSEYLPPYLRTDLSPVQPISPAATAGRRPCALLRRRAWTFCGSMRGRCMPGFWTVLRIFPGSDWWVPGIWTVGWASSPWTSCAATTPRWPMRWKRSTAS